MIAWHGSDRRFTHFAPEHIGTGEAAAKRGIGFNFTLDPDVARHYAGRGASTMLYLYELAIPDEDELLDLDAPIEGNEYLVFELHSALGLDHDAIFEEAAADEGISMSYPDERAEAMWERVLLNVADEEAWEELREWSPGGDWASIRSQVDANAIGFDPRTDTLADFYAAALSRLENPEALHALLRYHGIRGTIGSEPISEVDDERARSGVVFSTDDIRIVSIHRPAQCPENAPPEP